MKAWMAVGLLSLSLWGQGYANDTVIHGSYANGCFAGGVTIPIRGIGYEQVRPSRARNYGDAALLSLIEHLGQFAKTQQTTVILGDMSQAHGGRMPYGHASHQIGLDVDIWFERVGAAGLQPNEKESLDTPSLVNAKTGQVVNWQPYYRDLLHQAAMYPQTERIFVNPVIKAHLCATEKDPAWLYKIRPWFGHDSHFHVRLKCPKNQPHCVPQAPVAKTSGCDADLNNWIKDQQDIALGLKKPSGNKKAPQKPAMPKACETILLNR
ncbi:penicillin-insensitive murein endopeptidase [Wohlfahrtiimonas chitiniclastica]|uniref:penicillin-insensitive murein endopeptidase n=1 Tax=Wohlfahrtiimonas chitiniclastica TaxID=400946 RepID=UPI0021582AC7|nr:penicillin-insensitive murein endopeptidase [Wohlfahrtiimonas chitiniclastica]MDC7251490.1 hypothetical protein [Wohlfahrtiimonas chitiniclastica]